jgi:putative two-component system response regulator
MSTEYEKPSLLIVDDSPESLSQISALLKDDYRLKVANSGERALKMAQGEPRPDLILLDIIMPEMDGYEVCQQLKADAQTFDIPIIFLTAKTDPDDEKHGFELGAVDYITKPISPAILLARVKTHLALKATADFLRDKSVFLEQEVTKRTREITAIQDVTIRAMAALVETRDPNTGNHIRRTQYYVKILAERLRYHPRFASYLNESNIGLLFKSAPLHDIGKVGIPDAILLKPGALTSAEFEIMKTHTTLGYQAICHAEEALGKEAGFLKMAKEIALYHQEKWDGSGYPQGLSGDEIPIAARLMALADVYDALVTERVYKRPVPHELAIQSIMDGKGTHFDPDVVDAFLQVQDQFQGIAQRFADTA